jgi:hypothetical protein
MECMYSIRFHPLVVGVLDGQPQPRYIFFSREGVFLFGEGVLHKETVLSERSCWTVEPWFDPLVFDQSSAANQKALHFILRDTWPYWAKVRKR